MHNENETTFFDVADNTALVCIDHQQYQKLVVPQLLDIGYKVHLGLFEDDVLLKLKTYNYHVVIIYEHFKGSTVPTNSILQEMIPRPGLQRRKHYVVLLSQRFATNDAMTAFVHSVDLIMNVSDLANFQPVLRRGVAQYRELYHGFQETLKAVEAL